MLGSKKCWTTNERRLSEVEMTMESVCLVDGVSCCSHIGRSDLDEIGEGKKTLIACGCSFQVEVWKDIVIDVVSVRSRYHPSTQNNENS
jgi:hypothetical protein